LWPGHYQDRCSTQAAALDPNWDDPAVYAGDSFFRLKDVSNAGIWFAKAIAIDPDLRIHERDQNGACFSRRHVQPSWDGGR
jgi:hypothetical protein